jgi:hypothetical protein
MMAGLQTPITRAVLHFFTVFEWLSGLSYILLALSYASRNIKWLRTLVLGASLLDMGVCYGTRAGASMWAQLFVTLLIILVNLYQLYVLYRESRPIHFSDEAASLHQRAFADLTAGEFNRLLQCGTFETLAAGAQLTRKGQPLEAVYVFLAGELDVKLGEVVLTRLINAGTFIGDMGYITGSSASVDVLVARASRLFRLPVAELEALRRARPDLHIKLRGILSGGIADKLRQSDARLLAHLDERPQAG